MWTAKNRGRYDRSKLRYPSDLTDDEWAHVAPLIAPAKRGGNRRHVDVRLVDTLGLLLHAIVHPADIQDRDDGILLLATLFGMYPFLKSSSPTLPIRGRGSTRPWRKSCRTSKLKSPGAPIMPTDLWCCPSAKLSSAPSPGLIAAVGSPRIGRTSIARRSHSFVS